MRRIVRYLIVSVTVMGALLVPAVAQAAPTAPCAAAARACVQLSTNQAWLMSNGKVTYGPVRISHGKPGYATPPGKFKVTFKDRDHVSSQYHSPMPFSVFFNRGIAFHQGDTGSQSHGCVRMSMDAAQQFFNTLRPGDAVHVVN